MVDLKGSAEALLTLEQRQPRLTGAEHARAAAMGEQASFWRCSRIALRGLIARRWGEALARADFHLSDAGKPSLPSDEVHFSIAHTGAAALIALSDRPVGVDIETTVRTVRIAPDRRARLIETAAALNPGVLLPADETARFLQAWVRLEAVAKATGEGLGPLLSRAGVFGPQNRVAAATAPSPCVCRDLALDEFFSDGYLGAVAVVAGGLDESLAVSVAPFSARLTDQA